MSGLVKSLKSEFIPYTVQGYLIKKPLTSNNAGNCTWGYAEKYGKIFFIKQFLTPKFPDVDADMYESTRKHMIGQCEKWYHDHEEVYNAIVNCGGGNIVAPLDFFLEKNIYYLVTEKIDRCRMKFENLYTVSKNQKEIIMKVLANEISCLAKHDVVHSDLKPENLILKSTVRDYFTVKIIDFDASFLSSNPPDPDDITGDQVYFSPEMLLYMAEEEVSITPKSDVFALGIIFHLILCGEIPKFDPGYNCLGQAVLNGYIPELNTDISTFYRDLITNMLCVEPEQRLSAEEVLMRLLNKSRTVIENNIRATDMQNSVKKSENGLYVNFER